MHKKILLCITKSTAGGAQKYVYDLAAHLPADQFNIAVVAGGRGPLFEMLAQKNIRTISVPGLGRNINPLHELKAFIHLVRIFIRERPDIIHLNSSKMGFLGAVAARTAKALTLNFASRVIFTVHGWGFREDRNALERFAIFAASWIAALFHHHTIVINLSDHQDAAQFIAHKKISFIPLGISSPAALLSRSDARAFFHTKEHPITDDTFLIGAIAELTANKGLAYLIDAIKEVHAMLPEKHICCIIMGDGEERAALLDRIKKLNLEHSISLAGFVTDAYRYLPAFDLFTLTSVKEGLPYAIMEAMAAELPVVASRIGGIPDLIIHKKNGMLVHPKEPQSFADHIVKLIESDENRRILAANAKETIAAHHSLERMIIFTAQCYDTLTQSHQ